MVDIIRLNDDPHAQTQRLLPWYVTGILDERELARVEQHLAECAECREDVEIEKALAQRIRSLPRDVERGWASLKSRIDQPEAPPPRAKTALFDRRVRMGWVVAAQAASLAVVVPIVVFTLGRPALPYRTLGSAAGPGVGNLIVTFRPDSSEATLRATLLQNQARIVDGPTRTDAYVLHVAADRRAEALARLKSDRNVALAEPLDGADR